MHPIESVLIEVWKDKERLIPVGRGDYVGGVELLRRLLLRGYDDLTREIPDALPPPKIDGKAITPALRSPANEKDENGKKDYGKKERPTKDEAEKRKKVEDDYGGGPL